MGIDFLAEPSDPFRNQDVINAKLKVGVFVANMELAIGVLGDAGSLQDNLVKWRIGALRFVLNLCLPDGIFGSALNTGRSGLERCRAVRRPRLGLVRWEKRSVRREPSC